MLRGSAGLDGVLDLVRADLDLACWVLSPSGRPVAGTPPLAPADRHDPSDQGPTYLVSGGAGAPLDNCPDNADSRCGSFNHYLVFDVNEATVKVQVIRVAPGTEEKIQSK